MRLGKLDLNTLHDNAVVNASVANVRQYAKGEGGGLAKIVGQLPRGRNVHIMSQSTGAVVNGDNNWWKIADTQSSTVGWMHNSVLDEVGKTVMPVDVKINGGGRSAPFIRAEADETDDWSLLDTYDPAQGYRNPLPSWVLYGALAGILYLMVRK